ncbi:MAG: MBL fold metallo-hydrolase [Clostridia bacterium]|nr:MBL fold metallo-hydrolase [Clostridia bacterium]
MARFCPLFSSSSGNSYLIGGGGEYILIDAGVSAKRLETAVKSVGVEPENIKAVFITHEHIDHISGTRVLCSRYKMPVYATEGTLRYMEKHGHLAGVSAEVMPGGGVEIAGMSITNFATPHDSSESCGYRVTTTDGRRAAIATDIGVVTDEVKNGICGCDLVVLESNHDIGMLRCGPYPYVLKQRILSDIGHLSNESCARELPSLVEAGTTRIFLGHLSKENNYPDLARLTSLGALHDAGMEENVDFVLSVNPPENSSPIVIF